MMKKVKLGNSDLFVSPLCLGCMSFGREGDDQDTWLLDYESSEAIVKRALDLGINFFDTANVYADGRSEIFLGKALKKYAKREDVVIATKVYFNEGHLSREAILREVDKSLERLGTDYIDLYIIHRFDQTTPIEETMKTLHELVLSGKVRALGASAMYAFQFHMMQNIAKQKGWTEFISMQNHYNLMYREDEREMIPLCKMMNVALTPYSPLAAGRLSREDWSQKTKRMAADKVAISKYDSTYDADLLITQQVKAIALKHNTTMTQIALAWQYEKRITAPLIGITKLDYLDDAVGAVDVRLSQDDIEALEANYIPHKVVGALKVS